MHNTPHNVLLSCLLALAPSVMLIGCDKDKDPDVEAPKTEQPADDNDADKKVEVEVEVENEDENENDEAGKLDGGDGLENLCKQYKSCNDCIAGQQAEGKTEGEAETQCGLAVTGCWVTWDKPVVCGEKTFDKQPE